MLYLIGGAARTGKTILSQRLLKERNIPYFCLDYLINAIDRTLHNIPSREAAIKIWPNLEAMLRRMRHAACGSSSNFYLFLLISIHFRFHSVIFI